MANEPKGREHMGEQDIRREPLTGGEVETLLDIIQEYTGLTAGQVRREEPAPTSATHRARKLISALLLRYGYSRAMEVQMMGYRGTYGEQTGCITDYRLSWLFRATLGGVIRHFQERTGLEPLHRHADKWTRSDVERAHKARYKKERRGGD